MVHKAAIDHIVRTVPGAINNHYGTGFIRVTIDGRVPDVVVKWPSGRIKEAYEVEGIHKSRLRKKRGLKRILVIALEDDDWDEIKLLRDNGKQILEQMTVDHQDLEALDRKVRVQRSRLKGYNKRIGRKLSFAREKKKVDDGWS